MNFMNPAPQYCGAGAGFTNFMNPPTGRQALQTL